jgi:hypothetical protein
MNKSQEENDEVVEEEPSEEEKILLSHMDSQDIYDEDNVPNIVEEDEIKEKNEEEEDPYKLNKTKNEGILSHSLLEHEHKNLEDSLEMGKEPIIKRESTLDKIEPESMKISIVNNERPKTAKLNQKKKVNVTLNLNHLHNSNDRYLHSEPKEDEDDRNRSLMSYQHRSDKKNEKKHQKKKKINKELEKAEKREEAEFESEAEIEDKENYLNGKIYRI